MHSRGYVNEGFMHILNVPAFGYYLDILKKLYPQNIRRYISHTVCSCNAYNVWRTIYYTNIFYYEVIIFLRYATKYSSCDCVADSGRFDPDPNSNVDPNFY